MTKTLASVILLIFLFATNNASAQWIVDTATNAEIQAHDQPYIILQKEIETKLCNNDWSIPENAFLLLKNDPYHRLILRGKSIDAFSFTAGGDACTIGLKQSSPLYKAILDTTKEIMKKETDDMKMANEIWRNSAKNNYKISASEQRTADSLKRIDKALDRKLRSLPHEQTFADVSLDINENWTTDLTNGTKNQFMPAIPGIKHAVLSIQYPDAENSDTSYYAYLYMGNWPPPDLKKRVLYTFKYNKDYGSIAKKALPTPVIENFVVFIRTYHYKNLMEVIQSIDWTKLDGLIKKSS